MGERDDELSEPASDAQLAASEAATRRLLARYDQPQQAAPPRDLAARVRLSLALERQQAAAHRWRLALLPLLGLIGCVALGLWGVLGDSAGPAGLLGGDETGAGRLLLLLTLAAKPLVNALLAAGPQALGLVGLLAVGGWLWWRVVAASRPAALLERHL